MDKLTALRVFRRVVELNGFVRAADDMSLSKAAVSKNVRELETALGTALLTRTTRSLSLTDAGARYFQQCCRILDSLEEADLEASATGSGMRGRLRITAPMSLGLESLTRRLFRFQDRYPGLALDLVLSDQSLDLVDGGYDLALRGSGGLRDSSLKARRLCQLDRVLCAAPSYLETTPAITHPQDLKAQDCLIFSYAASPAIWQFERGGAREDVDVTGRLAINNSIALRAAVLAGRGVVLIPRFLVRSELAEGTLTALLPDWSAATQAVYAVYPDHRESSPKVRALIDFLVQDFAERPL